MKISLCWKSLSYSYIKIKWICVKDYVEVNVVTKGNGFDEMKWIWWNEKDLCLGLSGNECSDEKKKKKELNEMKWNGFDEIKLICVKDYIEVNVVTK